MSQILGAGGGGPLIPTNFADSPIPSVSLTAVPGTAVTAKRSDEILALDPAPAYAFLGLGATVISQQGASASALTLTGGTVTTSQPLIKATQTWNASAVPFFGFTFNVTNTASHASSSFLGMQVSGANVFRFLPNWGESSALPGISFGNGTVGGAYTNDLAIFANTSLGIVGLAVGGSGVLAGYSGGLLARSDKVIAFNSVAGLSSILPDVILSRGGIATLQHGAADATTPVAQFITFQGTSANNTSGANGTLTGSLSKGSGVSGDVIFRTGVAPGAGSPSVSATPTESFRVKGETQAFTMAAGKKIVLGNAATIGLVAGALAALSNASIVLTDSTGQDYRIPCII